MIKLIKKYLLLLFILILLIGLVSAHSNYSNKPKNPPVTSKNRVLLNVDSNPQITSKVIANPINSPLSISQNDSVLNYSNQNNSFNQDYYLNDYNLTTNSTCEPEIIYTNICNQTLNNTNNTFETNKIGLIPQQKLNSTGEKSIIKSPDPIPTNLIILFQIVLMTLIIGDLYYTKRKINK